MATLFPDSTRRGAWPKRGNKVSGSSTKAINDSAVERITATGGTRTLTIKGLGTTGNLAYNANAATIKAALEALADDSQLTVTGGAGGPYAVTFADPGANALTGTPSLTGGANTISIVKGNGGLQTVTLGVGNTGGSFTLTYNGQTTGAIAYNATGATVKAALLALSNLGLAVTVNQSSVTGPENGIFGSPNITVITNTYDFTHNRNLEVGNLQVNPSSLTGGSASVYNGESWDGLQRRAYTQEALSSAGLLRRQGTVSNDVESFNRRKPRDIGDPKRIPGEE